MKEQERDGTSTHITEYHTSEIGHVFEHVPASLQTLCRWLTKHECFSLSYDL